MPDLFTPLELGALKLPNRILMAPLTRTRTEKDHLPTPLMAEYYAQRASAGLLIAEATMVMEGNSSFWREPGIYSSAHAEAWKLTTDAVHKAGGRIFVQLWHGGRACHPLLNNGAQPVAPSALKIDDNEVMTPEGKKPYVIPHELTDEEIPTIVEGFRKAAEYAKEAGFDGVEIHGANGYLVDQFLRDGSNHRTGKYGGSIENRARFLFEILTAVSSVYGSDRVGLRISPLNRFNSMTDSDPAALTAYVTQKLNDFNLAYLHVTRDRRGAYPDVDLMAICRENYKGLLIGNAGFDREEADAFIKSGEVDAVAFGVSFLANPDLPARLKAGAPLNQADPTTFYGQGPKGYTDYPTMD